MDTGPSLAVWTQARPFPPLSLGFSSHTLKGGTSLEVGFQYSLTTIRRECWSAAPVPAQAQNPRQTLVLEPRSCERVPHLTCLPLGVTQFLYSPALLEVLSKQDTLNVLTQSLRDPSPEVRVLSLPGLRNVLFHPEKVSPRTPWLAHTPDPQGRRDTGVDKTQCAGVPALSLPAV